MFLLRKPTDEQIRGYLTRIADSPFTYPQQACSRDLAWPLPRGWNRDHERVLLGRGEQAFQRAKQAIRDWTMFPHEVATLCWADCPLDVGRTVAVLYRSPFCWMVFPAKIVYVIDETTTTAGGNVFRFGFAYGTVADHAERGEERFLVEWNRRTDEVWYDLLAISQPAHWLARLGYPYTRYEQARFRRLSCTAMQRAVAMIPPTNSSRIECSPEGASGSSPGRETEVSVES